MEKTESSNKNLCESGSLWTDVLSWGSDSNQIKLIWSQFVNWFRGLIDWPQFEWSMLLKSSSFSLFPGRKVPGGRSPTRWSVVRIDGPRRAGSRSDEAMRHVGVLEHSSVQSTRVNHKHFQSTPRSGRNVDYLGQQLPGARAGHIWGPPNTTHVSFRG